VYKNQKQIETISPDFTLLSKIKIRGVIVTAISNQVDFVSRFFAPKLGVNEDPVTGSAHTLLIPYWRKKLKKNTMIAKQLSVRQGILKCQMKNDRVYISGKVKTYQHGGIINL
jgi:predicted PhzF superfamily epimerase YddE/YHI9